MNSQQINKYHLIGVGGSGMSGVAQILIALGKHVRGTDLYAAENTNRIVSLGGDIRIGPHKAENVEIDTQCVVFSNAITPDNPELQYSRKKSIPAYSYPEFVAQLFAGKIPIVIAGTHGKSTTAAMVAKIFIDAGLDPCVLIGANAPFLSGSSRVGSGKHFILEGDEYRAAFLHYAPIGLCITNIERDHLDFYQNEQSIVETFRTMVQKVPPEGIIVANILDKNVVQALQGVHAKIIHFGIEYGDLYATHIHRRDNQTYFSVKGKENFDIILLIPGLHNVSNALAAAAVAISFGIDTHIIASSLSNFTGIGRRFEIKGSINGITIIDDYAHHPTEIKATLRAARQHFPDKTIWCIFQPHSGNRTDTLFDDFVRSFNDCDHCVVTDIFKVAGREGMTAHTSNDLVESIRKLKTHTYYKPGLENAVQFVCEKAKPESVIITMGAGSITQASEAIVRRLQATLKM
ncbi:MAG: UDP-N-acetylmuramate--L-alanine ligase [Patescibacteria group bacterium]|nr:UDP-N-acetylmuramate--L-alanine ligase [Patescibacteria group bacterium]MDD5715098.1 UDP-N-acetylmuramate--L-alanine ligase [Patescibacteria group bacterium]